ncbi:hypothetical protein MLD38_019473 [Melastoma candidum]|uniref:Uncharacterized protein n=1 Tax=Melastoma candidum TaxID=119954 RepID=A0ACB9QXN6_9MYRT|nr:hypothetical protein MLD38_019473 [Melastoma candidum]
MSERSAKPRKYRHHHQPSAGHLPCEEDPPPSSAMLPRRSSLLKRALLSLPLLLLAFYAFLSFSPLSSPSTSVSDYAVTAVAGNVNAPALPLLEVFMYDLPEKFNYGVIKHHALVRSSSVPDDLSSLKYPGHQHMAEWYLYSDLLAAYVPRPGSPVVRVSDPAKANVFYVPVFSSLSLIVNQARPANSDTPPAYSDEEMQDDLASWLEEQEHWKRNNGRDHVVIAQDPNALYKVIDRVRNAVLLVSDFGRLKGDQASLVKDIILPYSHRINTYAGNVGVEKRKTLLFFMGNRYRKDGGKIRDLLFQLLENEKDVIIKHGTQSRESRRAASQGMHTSKFCLNPAGDTPSACRLFDAIVSMCIPVIVSDSIELPFEDVIDYSKISIFVDTTSALKPGYLVSLLREVSEEKILEYQKEIKKVKRYFEYGDPNGTVNEIWRQVSQKLPLIRLMINRDKRVVKGETDEPDCSCICSNQTGLISTL